MKYSEYAGRKWGELSQDEKDFLLEDAVCRVGMTLSPLADGEGIPDRLRYLSLST